MQQSSKKVTNVFYYALLLVLITVVLGAINPTKFSEVTGNINTWITTTFGWYYVIITSIFVFACLFLILSPIGKLN